MRDRRLRSLISFFSEDPSSTAAVLPSGQVEPAQCQEVWITPIDGYNELQIEIGTPGEYLRFLHTKTGSITAAAGGVAFVPRAAVRNTKIAEAGTRGADNCHLHTGYREAAVTIPLGFRYELWHSEAGGYWSYVANGMPHQDDIIRKP